MKPVSRTSHKTTRTNSVVLLLLIVLFVTLFSVLSLKRHAAPLFFGSLTDIGRTKEDREILDVSFDDGTVSHTLAADSVAFVVTPDDPSISHGAPLSAVFGPNDSSILGYKYTTRAAAIENEGKPLFRDRFPGEFFGSEDQRAAFAGFAEKNGIVIHPLDEVTLESSARYFIRTFGTPVAMTVRGVAWCGNHTLDQDEDCERGVAQLVNPCTSGAKCDLDTCQCPMAPGASSSSAALSQCNDGIDNDNDGFADLLSLRQNDGPLAPEIAQTIFLTSEPAHLVYGQKLVPVDAPPTKNLTQVLTAYDAENGAKIAETSTWTGIGSQVWGTVWLELELNRINNVVDNSYASFGKITGAVADPSGEAVYAVVTHRVLHPTLKFKGSKMPMAVGRLVKFNRTMSQVLASIDLAPDASWEQLELGKPLLTEDGRHLVVSVGIPSGQLTTTCDPVWGGCDYFDPQPRGRLVTIDLSTFTIVDRKNLPTPRSLVGLAGNTAVFSLNTGAFQFGSLLGTGNGTVIIQRNLTTQNEQSLTVPGIMRSPTFLLEGNTLIVAGLGSPQNQCGRTEAAGRILRLDLTTMTVLGAMEIPHVAQFRALAFLPSGNIVGDIYQYPATCDEANDHPTGLWTVSSAAIIGDRIATMRGKSSGGLYMYDGDAAFLPVDDSFQILYGYPPLKIVHPFLPTVTMWDVVSDAQCRSSLDNE
ncbi:MAG: hypothetical protein V1926_00880 [Candidatus Peregrinibacteria bacterium]